MDPPLKDTIDAVLELGDFKSHEKTDVKLFLLDVSGTGRSVLMLRYEVEARELVPRIERGRRLVMQAVEDGRLRERDVRLATGIGL